MNLYLKRFMGILAALFIFGETCTALNYMYVSRCFAKDQTRSIWHYYYENKGKIDNLYLGSSHVYVGVKAVQLDELNGKYNFNLASSSQVLNGSYYLLKEADRDNSLSNVYLELYYRCHAAESSKQDSIEIHYYDNWLNTDYMKNSINKWEYMFSICDCEKYIDMMLPFVRYRTNMGNWEYVNQTIKEKKQDNYLAYQWGSGSEYEKGVQQGYIYSGKVLSDAERLYSQKIVLDENPIGATSEKYLEKIIQYCQKRDISITLFIVPITELELISTENYDNYINQVRKIAEKYDIAFYDFNLAKEEYLPIQYNEYFQDSNHLNDIGATLFTAFFDEVVSGTVSENEKYFYISYEEKLQSVAPAIYGLYYRDSEELRIYHIASNRDDGIEYRITIRPCPDESRGAEQLVIQDYSENKEFALSGDKHGICTIEARMKNELKIIQTLEINY